MNSVPLVSVIMPVYNAEKYLNEAVESILNQTYSHIEFIIIDDCSTDSSYNILQKYKQIDKRIKLLKNEENSKQAMTRNRAIKCANGKYIAFMDADDISMPNRLARQVNFMESNLHIGVCGTWIKFFSASDSNYSMEIKSPSEHEEIRIKMLFEDCCIAQPAAMIRSGIFKEKNLCYQESLGGAAEDYDLWNRALKAGLIFYNLPEILLHYRISETQTIALYKDQIEVSRQKIISDNYFTYFATYLDKKKLKDYIRLRFLPKNQLNVTEQIYYQYLISLIKKINTKHNLFTARFFNPIMDREKVSNLIKRYLFNKFKFE